MKIEASPDELAELFIKFVEKKVALELGKLRMDLESYAVSRIDCELAEFGRKLQQKTGPI